MIAVIMNALGISFDYEQNEKQDNVSYAAVTVDTIASDINKSEEEATDKYVGKYYAVTGRFSSFNLLSDNNPTIYLEPVSEETDEFSLACDLQNEEQKEMRKSFQENQLITVYGKITDMPWDGMCDMTVDYMEETKEKDN